MTVAYNGEFEFRPGRDYIVQRESSFQARRNREREQDANRLDELFERFPGRDDVDRDEDRIAKVLVRAEKRQSVEHRELMDSYLSFSVPADFLGTANLNFKSKKRKSFEFESA